MILRILICMCSLLLLTSGQKKVSEDVIAYLGIPYANAPIGELRFTESSPISFDASREYNDWRARCIYRTTDKQHDEDCLYLNVFRHKDTTAKTKTILYLTNDVLSDVKVSKLVTNELNVVVASVRDGVLGTFGNASYSVSDVISVLKFLRENSNTLLIDLITVWGEESIAESITSAMEDIEPLIVRSILINGHYLTRTLDRDHYATRATYKLKTNTGCDIPSLEQSNDCLRSLSIDNLLEQSNEVINSFAPYGNPFRPPVRQIPESAVPAIYGLYKKINKEYPNLNDFTEKYTYQTFKRFLAGLLPDSLHKNGPLLRRFVLHQYIHSLGDKKNTYHLFEQQENILLDRDYHVPTDLLMKHVMEHKLKAWILVYGIDNPPTTCLQEGGWEDEIQGFCERKHEYYSRFARLGAPTPQSCEAKNPTFPMLGSSKREYHVILHADGQPEWKFNFHRANCELWNNLMPYMDSLELVGRRDVQFPEETETDPLLLEDDVQVWHEKASGGPAQEEEPHLEL